MKMIGSRLEDVLSPSYGGCHDKNRGRRWHQQGFYVFLTQKVKFFVCLRRETEWMSGGCLDWNGFLYFSPPLLSSIIHWVERDHFVQHSALYFQWNIWIKYRRSINYAFSKAFYSSFCESKAKNYLGYIYLLRSNRGTNLIWIVVVFWSEKIKETLFCCWVQSSFSFFLSERKKNKLMASRQGDTRPIHNKILTLSNNWRRPFWLSLSLSFKPLTPTDELVRGHQGSLSR